MAGREEIQASLLTQPGAGKRHSSGKKWFVFNRSPLARKIILFNLVALGILVSGVLYLNQTQDTQIQIRSDTLTRQAEMISAAILSHTESPEIQSLDGPAFNRLFEDLVAQADSIVSVYNTDGEIKIMHVPEEDDSLEDSSNPIAFIGVLQNIWATLSSSGRLKTPEENQNNLDEKWRALVFEAMSTGQAVNRKVLSVDGEIYVSAALPLSGADGMSGAILISTKKGEFDSIIRRDREKILQMFLLATLSSIILSMVLANSIARPLRRLSAAAEKAQDEAGGKINLARVNIPDLTARPDEIGDLSRSMRNMTDALLDRVDENKSFAADVAHEIKNPLTSMRSAVETLDYVTDDESRTALLEVIQNDVDRLDRLVTDISNASRLEGELVRDKWEPVNLEALLTEMVRNFKERGGHDGVEIQLKVNSDNSVVRGLTSRLAQVFTNLIGNALSFVPEDGGWVRITISDYGADEVLIEVNDNGPGIPEANVEDIFSRFYSERPAAQFGEHSGLGLAISKQIVEAHNGIINARNAKPFGAKFCVILPR